LAAQVLATAEDFEIFGISGGRLKDFTPTAKLRLLSAASAQALSILRKRYTMPLASWGDDLRCYVCQIAAYRASQANGYKIEEGASDTVRQNYLDAIALLRAVANRRAELDDLIDSSIDDEGGVFVSSDGLLLENYADIDILSGEVFP
jgi:phage gp36-like protein